jgi:hypothetical protein
MTSKKTPVTTSLGHTHALRQSRMRQFEREVHSCEWAMRSARVFFGADGDTLPPTDTGVSDTRSADGTNSEPRDL